MGVRPVPDGGHDILILTALHNEVVDKNFVVRGPLPPQAAVALVKQLKGPVEAVPDDIAATGLDV